MTRRHAAAMVIMMMLTMPVWSQYTMPEVLDTASLKAQMDYLEDRTRIYNDYRAIREDMFQKIKKNSVDSLTEAGKRILGLKLELGQAQVGIDSLNILLTTREEELEEAIRNKNNLPLLGLNMSKVLYNLIMWIVVLSLAVLLVILFLSYRQSHAVTVRTKKELEETREEFETHRKQAREKYEKLVVSHHNEIRKLKEGSR